MRVFVRSGMDPRKLTMLPHQIARQHPGRREHVHGKVHEMACRCRKSDLDGDGFLCLGYKSSRLTKAEFSDLIECINEYAARMNINLSRFAEEVEE